MARGRTVNSLLKFSTKMTTLGKLISIRDNPNSHYLPSLFTSMQAYIHKFSSELNYNNLNKQATRG
jgi:hypothetical protein